MTSSGAAATSPAVAGRLRQAGHTAANLAGGGDKLESSGGGGKSHERLIRFARENGVDGDPAIRQNLAQLFTYNEISRYTNLRQRALRAQGKDIPGLGNIMKLSMSRILRLQRDTSGAILGPYATLHGYSSADTAALASATGRDEYARVTEAMLFAQGPPIYGGTDEIQHNIIGERVLGLPKEPSVDADIPFRQVRTNRRDAR